MSEDFSISSFALQFVKGSVWMDDLVEGCCSAREYPCAWISYRRHDDN
jgi:hypothetical protein